jgi:tetratricopeptide (TPR) repeat protein
MRAPTWAREVFELDGCCAAQVAASLHRKLRWRLQVVLTVELESKGGGTEMSEDNPPDGGTMDVKDWVDLLVKVLGLSTVAAILLHMLGFVIVNTSLLRYGVYDFSILRVRFIAAGVAYVSWWLILAWAAVVFLWLGRRLWKEAKGRLWRRTLAGAAVLSLAILFAMLYAGWWLVDQPRARSVLPLVVWSYALFVLLLSIPVLIYRVFRHDDARVRALSASSVLLVIMLFPYGRLVYDSVPPSLGGGSPVHVQFVIKGEQVGNLEALGIVVSENGALTQRMRLLTETEDRLVVLTQDQKAVSFDAGAVEGIRYDAEYHRTAGRYYQDGDAYLKEKQYEKARDVLWQALLLDADHVEAWLSYGVALMHLEQYEDAVEAFGEIVPPKRSPEVSLRVEAYYCRARTNQLCGEAPDLVTADLRRALNLDAETCISKVERDQVFVRLTQYEPFMTLIFATRSAAAYRYGHVAKEYYDAKQPEEAEWAYLATIDLATAEGDGIYAAQCREWLARVYIDLGDLEKAEEQYKLAISDDPRNPVYHYRLAEFWESQGEWEEVVEQCREVIIVEPNYIAAYILRGNALREQGTDYDKAVEDYEWAIILARRPEVSSASHEALAHYEWARLESRRAQLDEAFDHLAQATSLSSKYIIESTTEPDFEALKADPRFADLLYPQVAAIEAIDVLSIRFKLVSPSDTFVYRLAAAMRCEGLPDLLEYQKDAEEEFIPGGASSWAVSDDGLTWTFELREDADYTADEMAARLSAILELKDAVPSEEAPQG